MRRLALIAAACPLLAASCTWAPRQPEPSRLLVEEVARFDTDQVTGIAASRVSGRVFLCFPLWHDGHRVHVAELSTANGSWRPYPDYEWNGWREGDPVTGGGSDRFICVQALFVDDQDALWALDPAAPRMQGRFAPGATPKLVRFDPTTNTPARVYFIGPEAAPEGAYLNDFRIDTRTGHAFITDSSLGGLVVLDLNSGAARRVLADHPSTMAEPEVVPVIEGIELRFAGGPNAGKVPQVHSDGIAYDTLRGWVYWQALTARTLYRIRASDLIDETLTDDDLAARTENLGRSVVTDGMEVDERGNVYFTALEHNAIVVRTPDGRFHTLARSASMPWPDAIAFGPGEALYFTVAQINRTAWFNPDAPPATPYRVFRTTRFQR